MHFSVQFRLFNARPTRSSVMTVRRMGIHRLFATTFRVACVVEGIISCNSNYSYPHYRGVCWSATRTLGRTTHCPQEQKLEPFRSQFRCCLTGTIHNVRRAPIQAPAPLPVIVQSQLRQRHRLRTREARRNTLLFTEASLTSFERFWQKISNQIHFQP